MEPVTQTVVESSSVNSFKNGLDNMRALKMGFFVDLGIEASACAFV